MHSSSVILNVGVPQGSILGPLLFLLFINDMASFVKYSELLFFADDDTLVCCSRDPYRLAEMINHDLQKINQYVFKNRLLINNEKTKCMWFRCPNINHDILLNNNVIARVDTFKLLGVQIDSNFKFKSQINHLSGKLASASYILKKYKRQVPKFAMQLIFNCLATPHIHYCIISYFDFLNLSDINQISSKLIRCAKIFNNTPTSDLNLTNIAMYNKISILYNIIQTGTPSHLASYFIKPGVNFSSITS